ncbi:MAG: hypothetical protein ACRDBP_03555, partial [Luteolibacter sp.]
RKDFVRDESGKVVTTTLDESTLKEIAEVTNALYVPLGRGAEGLDTLYQEKLRLVPKTEQDQRMERIPLERFEWPLGLAILFLLLEFFITDRRRPKSPRALPSAARRHKIPPQTTALLAFGFVIFPSIDLTAAEASVDPRKIYNEGTEFYTKGDFAKASESLRSSLRTQDLALQQRSYYNLGNTLYRTGQGTLEKDPEATIKSWEESIKAYQDALSLNPADEDASYNKVLVEKKLEELKKQQKQDDKKDDQKKKDDQEKKDEKESKDSKDGEKPEDKGEPKDGEDPKDGDKPEDGKDPKEGDKPGEDKDGKEPKDGKEIKDGEKTDEEKADQEAKDAKEGDEQSGEKQPGEMSNERTQKQEMTPEEAKQLLEALRQDERTVIPIPQPQRNRFSTPDNSTKGKTW